MSFGKKFVTLQVPTKTFKTCQQCMSLMEKKWIYFFKFPIFRYCRPNQTPHSTWTFGLDWIYQSVTPVTHSGSRDHRFWCLMKRPTPKPCDLQEILVQLSGKYHFPCIDVFLPWPEALEACSRPSPIDACGFRVSILRDEHNVRRFLALFCLFFFWCCKSQWSSPLDSNGTLAAFVEHFSACSKPSVGAFALYACEHFATGTASSAKTFFLVVVPA